VPGSGWRGDGGKTGEASRNSYPRKACREGAFAEKVFKEADDEYFEIHGRIKAGASATRDVGAGGPADFTDACGENDGIDRVLKLAIEPAGGGLAGLEHAQVEDERMNFRFPTGC
jgi:hypothetical protein